MIGDTTLWMVIIGNVFSLAWVGICKEKFDWNEKPM